MKAKPSVRKLWGVVFKKGAQPVIVFRLWIDEKADYIEGEAPRALLFVNRKTARDWCKSRNVSSSEWKFRPVRVRETVQVIK